MKREQLDVMYAGLFEKLVLDFCRWPEAQPSLLLASPCRICCCRLELDSCKQDRDVQISQTPDPRMGYHDRVM